MYGYISVFYNGRLRFEPETDKDWDRLEQLLDSIREAGWGHRIKECKKGAWLHLIDEPIALVKDET